MKIDIDRLIFYDGDIYDAYLASPCLFDTDHKTDIDRVFWWERVKECGDPVLEIGCGTGRVSIPLMEAGFSVVGVDFSQSMLAQARKKSDRVEWIQEDIRTFNLERKFACILAPYYVLNYFYELEDLEAVLKNCKTHLKSNGKLILDIVHLSPKFWRELYELAGVVDTLRKFIHPRTGEKIEAKFDQEYDFERQIYSEIIIYHFPNGKVVSDRLEHRIYFPQEIKAILKYNGFKVDRCFGNYDSTPFQENSPHHILVCSHWES
ncbi:MULTISPECIES: class I SAM-dependent methyltransferase [Spirulina sp. CCY15215]|uniref:class I SAM-dependent DNA methyltransferase n=1 Tax=Spirulina sp. CCY15215 TaxID=2767591 RepID=UPI0019511A55|nr:class I SAM-dependent methyltransferase [Spirulina major]